MQLVVYNEKCLKVLSNKIKMLRQTEVAKVWCDESDEVSGEILNQYQEIRACLNYHPIALLTNPTLDRDIWIFTSDGRNSTPLISDLIFIK
jgi:hypothetical protein